MRIALVQEHGPSELRGQFELTPEHALLIGVRREIPEEVEAALAGRADLLCPHQLAQGRDVRVVELACVVRVDTGGRTVMTIQRTPAFTAASTTWSRSWSKLS